MKIIPQTILASLTVVLFSTTASAQVFQDRIDLDIHNLSNEASVVTHQGDTLKGWITNQRSVGGTEQFTMKIDGEKRKLTLDEIKLLATNADPDAKYEDMGRPPVIENTKKNSFLMAGPPTGWVIYEKITFSGNQGRAQLAQLRNAGFDAKIKVYSHPDGENTGSTTINGISLADGPDIIYFVVIDGEPLFAFDMYRYRRKALEILYKQCDKFEGKKMKMKNFAEHVYIYEQDCN